MKKEMTLTEARTTPNAAATSTPAVPQHWRQLPFMCSPSDPVAKAAPQYFDLTDAQVVSRVLNGDDNAAYYLLYGRYQRTVTDAAKKYDLERNELVSRIYIHFRTKDGLGWNPQRFLKNNFGAYYYTVVRGFALEIFYQKNGYRNLTQTTTQEVDGQPVTTSRKVWQQREVPLSSFLSSDRDDDYAPKRQFEAYDDQSDHDAFAPVYDDQSHHEARDTAQQYLSHLTETQRRALYYRFACGHSTKETVKLLQADMRAGLIPTKSLNPAALDNTISRLRRALRQRYPHLAA